MGVRVRIFRDNGCGRVYQPLDGALRRTFNRTRCDESSLYRNIIIIYFIFFFELFWGMTIVDRFDRIGIFFFLKYLNMFIFKIGGSKIYSLTLHYDKYI